MTDRRRSEPLSRAGMARRDAILAATIAALDGRRRRRRAVRGGLLAAAVLVIGIAASRAAQVWRSPDPGVPVQVAAQPRIIVVADNRRTGRIQTVGDDELLQLLDQIHRPAGLVREGGSVRLTGAVNDELALPDAPRRRRVRCRRAMQVGRAMRCLAVAVLLLPACSRAAQPRRDVLLIEAGRYDAAFDAATLAAREAGLEPVFRERFGGVIETAPMPASTILEPWASDNATLGQGIENTIAWQRRRARFEFTRPGAHEADPGLAGEGGGPDVLGLREPETDLASPPGPVELRIRVYIDRAQAPGIQRDTWSRALTTRSVVRHGDEPWPPFLYWTPVSRDVAFEQRLMSAVQEAIGP